MRAAQGARTDATASRATRAASSNSSFWWEKVGGGVDPPPQNCALRNSAIIRSRRVRPTSQSSRTTLIGELYVALTDRPVLI